MLRLAKGHRKITVPSGILVILSSLWIIYQAMTSSISNLDFGILLLTGVLLIFNLQFFRDPIRVPDEQSEDLILAPADGVLFEIDTNSEPGVSIYRIRMRFWDVHVNYMPLTGTLVSCTKKRGLILPILPFINQYSKNRNARQTMTFKSPLGFNFQVIQISGTLAYRTVAYGKINDKYERGSKIGMIRYGSETDLHLPTDLTSPMISTGTKIKSGKTIISQLKIST